MARPQNPETCGTVRRTPEIEDFLNTLHNNTEALSLKLTQLINQLDPVLRDPNPKGEEGAPSRLPSTQLGGALCDLCNRLARDIDRVDDVMDRLELGLGGRDEPGRFD